MRKVIRGSNLPSRPPLYPTLVLWLFLDRYSAPGWIWGVLGTVLVIIWVAWGYDFWTQEEVDIFKTKSSD